MRSTLHEIHKNEKDSSQFSSTAMENTKLPISNTREYFKSADHGHQSLGEERKFLRQDDKKRPEQCLQYSQGRKSPVMFPSKIEKIHSMDIIAGAVNHSDPHLSINDFTVNPSVGIEMVPPHWTQVPVTDTDEDNSHLPACLYSKKGDAAQVSFPVCFDYLYDFIQFC